jgi:hypothetical protein
MKSGEIPPGYGGPPAPGYGAPPPGYGAPPPTYPSAYQPPIPPPQINTRAVNHQYQSHAPPTFNPQPEAPQYARFDTPSKPVNEDALPAMPVWGEGRSVHVEETVLPEKHGDLEMDRLDRNGSATGTTVPGAVAVGVGRRTPGRSPIERSPTSDEYGYPGGYQNKSLIAGISERGGNSPATYGNQYAQNGDYDDVSPIQQSMPPIYGAGAGYAQKPQYERRSPVQGYDQQYNQQDLRHSPAPPSSRYDSPTPLIQNGYGQQNTYNEAAFPTRTPSPQYAPPGSTRYEQHQPLAPARSPSPQYLPSGPVRYQSPSPAYPGQQNYESTGPAYSGQQSYQAFQPAQTSQYSGVTRKPVDDIWKGI